MLDRAAAHQFQSSCHQQNMSNSLKNHVSKYRAFSSRSTVLQQTEMSVCGPERAPLLGKQAEWLHPREVDGLVKCSTWAGRKWLERIEIKNKNNFLRWCISFGVISHLLMSDRGRLTAVNNKEESFHFEGWFKGLVRVVVSSMCQTYRVYNDLKFLPLL